MNKLFHLIFLALVCSTAFSQNNSQKQLSYYVNEHGLSCDSAHADFIRHIGKAINDTLFAFEDHYLSGELHQKGRLRYDRIKTSDYRFDQKGKQVKSSNSSSKSWTYHYMQVGDYTKYFKNGNLKKERTFKDVRPWGLEKEWYENGQLKSVHTYDTVAVDQDYLIIDFYDSLGNQLVKDGNGVYVSRKGDLVLDSGRVNSMKKDGIWIGKGENGRNPFEEQYKQGKLLSGVSYDSLGKEYPYDKLTEMPVYSKKGLPAFYKYIGSNLRYPSDARKKGIQGRVFVSFVVDKEGNTINVEVLRGIHPECDEQARKIIDDATFKIPGKRRGQAAKLRMILPITFKIG